MVGSIFHNKESISEIVHPLSGPSNSVKLGSKQRKGRPEVCLNRDVGLMNLLIFGDGPSYLKKWRENFGKMDSYVDPYWK